MYSSKWRPSGLKASAFKCVTLNHKISHLVEKQTDENGRAGEGRGRRERELIFSDIYPRARYINLVTVDTQKN